MILPFNVFCKKIFTICNYSFPVKHLSGQKKVASTVTGSESFRLQCVAHVEKNGYTFVTVTWKNHGRPRGRIASVGYAKNFDSIF